MNYSKTFYSKGFFRNIDQLAGIEGQAAAVVVVVVGSLKLETVGADGIKRFFTSPLTLRHNKLECLSLTSFLRVV